MKSAFRQNAEAQKFVQQKTTLAAAGQRLYNQTKNRKEGFQVNIKIIQRQCGGTEFLSQPHRLHLGAQNAAGVDELCFTLPEAWAGCTVALYLRRSDGTLLAPVSLDTQHCVTVDRRLTGSTGGQWMLAAIDASGYAAYTRPGSYDTYAILPTDGGVEELPPSQQEKQMLAKEFFGYGRNGIAIGLVIGGCASALYYRIFASGVQGALWFCVAATVVIMVGLLLLFAGMIRYAMMKK